MRSHTLYAVVVWLSCISVIRSGYSEQSLHRQNLRKHSESNETVSEAHVLMKEVGRNIDQVKRNREQLSRVKELSGILDGWLGPELTVLGELKLDGLLMENSKPRTVLLFQTMLIITKNKEDNRLQFKTYIHVSVCVCVRWR